MKGLSIQAAAFGQEAKSGTIEGLDVCFFFLYCCWPTL